MAQAKNAKKSDRVEARPIGEGKDPLAEGARLHNESNSTGETHYKADNSELKAEERAAKNRISGKDADERAEDHNLESPQPRGELDNTTEQDEVAKGRKEK